MGWIIGRGNSFIFRQGGGNKWSTYWATLISATVEDADTDAIVLTFPSAQVSLTDTDFTVTVNGVLRTVSSGSWAGAVFTLVLASDLVYGDVVVVTFIRTGGTANVTNNIASEPEVATYVTEETPSLSEEEKRRINEFVKLLKSKLSIVNLSLGFDIFYLLGGEGRECSFKNLVSNNYHATSHGATPPTHTPYRYMKGDGVGGYLNCNYKPKTNGSVFTLNSASIGVYTCENVQASSVEIGTRNATADNRTFLTCRNGTDKSAFFINTDITAAPSNNSLNGKGLFVASRTASDLTTVSRDGDNFGTSVHVSNDLSAHDLFIMALNTAGTPSAFSAIPMSCAFAGKGFVEAELLSINMSLLAYFNSVSVWKKQGTVIEETEGTDEEKNVLEPFVLYEDNAQVISTTGNVFKIWYTHTWGDSCIYYAESIDGFTWVELVNNPIIEGYFRACVIKNNGIYYLYAAHDNQTHIDLFTSVDGINFDLDTANVIVRGSAGAWDDALVTNLAIIIENGTWYLFYEAKTTGGVWEIGLATSPDGKTFTKYGGSAVITETGSRGGPNVHKIGSDFYMWAHGAVIGDIPTDLYRYKSSDLLSWIADPVGPVFQRISEDEGYNANYGQVADPCLLEVNGSVYMFYSASPSGNLATGHLHIKLAITNRSFADLILTNEGNTIY